MTREEFERLITARKRPRSLGIHKIDYSLTLEISVIVRDGEYLQELVLKFIVQEFLKKRMLRISFAGIILKRYEGLEQFFAGYKRSRKER